MAVEKKEEHSWEQRISIAVHRVSLAQKELRQAQVAERRLRIDHAEALNAGSRQMTI